ncbi:MAG: Gfo/Idh/MocA family oxidoreductase [Ktedonobacterales bacterium]|nr:Gfo/Idh/MocA family oxidoreductase [Ktedonobacterales bacterium]
MTTSANGRQPARAAIIGYGLSGAVFHAPLIAATPGLTVAAIVTNDPARRQQAAADFPTAALLTTDELWQASPPYDLVVVGAPNNAHLSLGLAALDSGAAVVMDKPFALTVADAQTLIDRSTAVGRPIVPYQSRRWDGDFQTVRHLLATGWLGEAVRFESRYDRFRPAPRVGTWREAGDPANGGGLLYDLGSHLIDQANQLFGVPSAVYAELPVRRAGSQVDDDSFVALTYPNGVVAHLYASQLARTPGPRFVVRGTAGTFVKYGMDPQEDALKSGLRPTPDQPDWGTEDAAQWGTLQTERDGLTFDGRITTLPGTYQAFYAGIAAMLHAGAPPPVLATDALLTQRVIAAAQISAASGSVVQL